MPDELVTIARFLMPSTAHEARIELERQGIEGVSVDEHAVSALFPGADGMAMIGLQVKACDVEQAFEILSQTPAAKNLTVELESDESDRRQHMPTQFIAKQAQLEAKIAEWAELAGPGLRVDHVADYVGNKVYAVTLTDPDVPPEGKRRHYFAQPHAHEPGTTAGMADVIEQLLTGSNLAGEATPLDVDEVLARTILTFNPIGNVQGREKAPVLCWDGSQYTNDEFWCWMRGEDPENPGKMWKRLDLWDDREENAPDPIGIVYEQIDEHRWVEPNRSHLSSYFRLFFQMDAELGYEAWLSLHQTEFVNSDRDCMIILPLEDLAEGEILEADRAWGQSIVDAWQAAGFRPKPEPVHLGYKGEQAEYFRRAFGELHKRMHIITTEVKNNAPDAPPGFQLQAQVVAIQTSIERLLAAPPPAGS